MEEIKPNQTQPSSPQENDSDIQANKTVAALSYLWILFLVPLLLKRDSKFAQFHAKQGLVLFIIEFLVWIPFIGWLLMIAIFVLWVFIALDVAANFGQGTGFAVLLIIFPSIMFLILGFGSYQYRRVALAGSAGFGATPGGQMMPPPAPPMGQPTPMGQPMPLAPPPPLGQPMPMGQPAPVSPPPVATPTPPPAQAPAPTPPPVAMPAPPPAQAPTPTPPLAEPATSAEPATPAEPVTPAEPATPAPPESPTPPPPPPPVS